MRKLLVFTLLFFSVFGLNAQKKKTVEFKVTAYPDQLKFDGQMILTNNAGSWSGLTGITFDWPCVTQIGGPTATQTGGKLKMTFQSWEVSSNPSSLSCWGGEYSGDFNVPPYGIDNFGDTIWVIIVDPKYSPKSFNAKPWKYNFSKDCFISSPSKLCLGEAQIAEWSGPSNLDKADVRVPANRKNWALAAAHTHRLFTNMVGAEITSLNYAFAQSMIEGRMACDAGFTPKAGDPFPLNYRAGSVSGGCFQILASGWAQLEQFYPDLYKNAAHPLNSTNIIDGKNFVTACLSKAMYDYTSFAYWEKVYCWNPVGFFAVAKDPYVAEEVLAYSYHDGMNGSKPELEKVFSTQRATYANDVNVINTITTLSGAPGIAYGERMRNNLIQLENNWSVSPSLKNNDPKYNWGGSNPAKPAHYQYFGCYNECYDWSDISAYIDEAAILFWHADVNFVKAEAMKAFNKLRPYSVKVLKKDSTEYCVAQGKPDKCVDMDSCSKKIWVYKITYDTIYSGCVNYENLGPVIDAMVLAFPAYSAEKGLGQVYFAQACGSPTAALEWNKSPICDGESTELWVKLYGTAPFTYSVKDPNGNIITRSGVSTPTDVLHVSKPGEYKVISIKDANGDVFLNCHNSSATVRKKLHPKAEWEKKDVGKCQTDCQKEGDVVVKFSNGSAPWSISYTDPTGVNKTIQNISAASYIVASAPVKKGQYTIFHIASGTCDTLLTDILEICNDTCATPAAAISGSKKICNGDSAQISIQLTGSAPYTIYINDGSKQNKVTASTSPYKFYAKKAGTYVVDSVVSGKCKANGTGFAKIDIDPITLVNIGPADTSLCSGSLTLNAGNGYNSYLWNDGKTTASNIASTSGKYKVTVKNATGCSSSDSINVNISSNLKVNLGKDTTLCSGSITLNAGSGFSSYAWNPSGSAISTIIVNTSGTYIVNIENASGCKGSDTIVVNIGQPITVDLGKDTLTICATGKVSLTAATSGGSGTFTYTWNGTPQANTINNISTEGWYRVVVSDANGCKGMDSLCLKKSSFLSVKLNDAVLCEGEDLKLNAGYDDNNYNISWNTNENKQYITVKTSGIYGVVIDDKNGCKGSDSMLLTVHPLPDVSSIATSANICTGDQTVIGKKLSGPYSYLWLMNAQNTETISVSKGGTYEVKIINTVSSCKNSIAVSVAENPKPEIILGADITKCEGEIITVAPKNIDTNAIYQWNGNTEPASKTITQGGTYILHASNSYACENSDTIVVAFKKHPAVDLAGGEDTLSICEGETQTLNAQNPGMTFIWNTTENSANITVKNKGIYHVKVSDGGCSSEDEVFVDVVSMPEKFLNQNIKKTYCFEEEDAVTLSTDLRDPYTYTWSNGNNGNAIKVKEKGTYTLSITLGKCTSKDEITLTEYCESTLFIPNAFTPNGDNKNEIFKAEGNFIDDFRLMVFNRWGEKIFESDNFNNGWNGTYNGQLVQQDVYVWKVFYSINKGDGKKITKEKIGRVTVLY